ncbi:MAG: hypothetical protein MUF31_13460 [Akkermansiaceae bacterium]|jgi:hypothetical protein|nr:hypothetical protein [Akkermansiaceae bacterium]
MKRSAFLAVLMIVVPAFGDVERKAPTTIAEMAKIEGVRVNCVVADGMCSLKIRLDPTNLFMGANSATYARLTLKDASGEVVGSTEIRTRLDFPEGAVIGPITDGVIRHSLYVEFSCSTASLGHSEIYFYNKVAKGSPSQRVALSNLLEVVK